jgi:hypothetical protein
MQMRLRGVKEHARSSVLAQARTIQGIFACARLEHKIFWMCKSQMQNLLQFDGLDQNLQ